MTSAAPEFGTRTSVDKARRHYLLAPSQKWNYIPEQKPKKLGRPSFRGTLPSEVIENER
jgi:hypothetical protein